MSKRILVVDAEQRLGPMVDEALRTAGKLLLEERRFREAENVLAQKGLQRVTRWPYRTGDAEAALNQCPGSSGPDE